LQTASIIPGKSGGEHEQRDPHHVTHQRQPQKVAHADDIAQRRKGDLADSHAPQAGSADQPHLGVVEQELGLQLVHDRRHGGEAEGQRRDGRAAAQE
jgi:hypothetical protein